MTKARRLAPGLRTCLTNQEPVMPHRPTLPQPGTRQHWQAPRCPCALAGSTYLHAKQAATDVFTQPGRLVH